MPISLLLAADVPSFSQIWADLIASLDLARRPEEILAMLGSLPLVGAAVVTAVGAACVMQGYKWHKPIVVVLALMLGFGVGRMISVEVGKSTVVAVALAVLLAAIAKPLLRYTVAFFAGLAGAGIGATVWTFLNPDQASLAWAGGGMGFIALALLSFIFFRFVVIVFTSVGGGAMFVMGAVDPAARRVDLRTVREQMLLHPGVIPLLVVTAAVVGIVHQQRARPVQGPRSTSRRAEIEGDSPGSYTASMPRVVASLLLSMSLMDPGAAMSPPESGPPADAPVEGNRLRLESSPYLLQHAFNPVDWWPWSAEALEEARRRDVPILVSIGYSTCYWCHVMERESFEDPAVAAILNRDFVPIKVDREQPRRRRHLHDGLPGLHAADRRACVGGMAPQRLPRSAHAGAVRGRDVLPARTHAGPTVVHGAARDRLERVARTAAAGRGPCRPHRGDRRRGARGAVRRPGPRRLAGGCRGHRVPAVPRRDGGWLRRRAEVPPAGLPRAPDGGRAPNGPRRSPP